MVLLLTAIDLKSRVREFACQIPNLEAAFDVLSNITTLGDTLTKASILDQGRTTQLPIDAFDGTAFLAPIQALEHQWQAILSDSTGLTVPNPDHAELLQWTRQQVRQYAGRITTIDDLIKRFSQLHQRAEGCSSRQSPQSGITNHFAAMLNKYKHLRGKTQRLHRTAVERLKHLTSSNL